MSTKTASNGPHVWTGTRVGSADARTLLSQEIRRYAAASRDGGMSRCGRRPCAHRGERAGGRQRTCDARRFAGGGRWGDRKLRHRDVGCQRRQQLARRAVDIVIVRIVRLTMISGSAALALARVPMRVPAWRRCALRVRVTIMVRYVLRRCRHVNGPQTSGTHRHRKCGDEGRKNGPGASHGNASVGRRSVRSTRVAAVHYRARGSNAFFSADSYWRSNRTVAVWPST